jgi:LmbE family N-acetylglucosaminyl deacetylase/CheY-like chemotaxis protein
MMQLPAPKMPTVLLVEDDPSQSLLFERSLSRRNLEVTVCNNGADGARLAARDEFAIVVTDMMLPEVSGLEVIGRSKQLYPWRPALLISAHHTLEATPSAMRQHIDGVLSKPFSIDYLADRVSVLVANSLRMRPPSRRTIVAVGAHPDDVELGCGGALARHRRAGDRVIIVTLTSGSHGGVPSARAAESRNAANVLGAELYHFDLPDTELERCSELIPTLSSVMASFEPSVVYTHTNSDSHQDHRAVHAATVVAARGVRNIFCYQSPSTTLAFAPTLFVDVADFLDQKAAQLACYAGQQHRPYFDADFILATARYWGRFAMYGLAEPMEVLRAIDV